MKVYITVEARLIALVCNVSALLHRNHMNWKSFNSAFFYFCYISLYFVLWHVHAKFEIWFMEISFIDLTSSYVSVNAFCIKLKSKNLFFEDQWSCYEKYIKNPLKITRDNSIMHLGIIMFKIYNLQFAILLKLVI